MGYGCVSRFSASLKRVWTDSTIALYLCVVATKFKKAWKPTMGEPVPQIKHVYKIVESSVFLKPYDTYKCVQFLAAYPVYPSWSVVHCNRKKVGNERFCYHGMPRDCQLGNTGRTTLCSSRSCPLCNILKTSFNTNLGSPEGGCALFNIRRAIDANLDPLSSSNSFGAAIYTSSAANKFVHGHSIIDSDAYVPSVPGHTATGSAVIPASGASTITASLVAPYSSTRSPSVASTMHRTSGR